MENTAVASSFSIDELEEFEQRDLICNICDETMCFSFYWSHSHLCYLKLISYKYLEDLPKKKLLYFTSNIKNCQYSFLQYLSGFF